MREADDEPHAGTPDGTDPHADREARLAEALADHLDRAARGEAPDRAHLLAEHPDLAADLAEALGASAELRARLSGAPLADRLGKYRIVREVGRGGMAVVYEAWDTVLDRRVALKVLPAGHLADPHAIERFEREARLLAKLHHPSIVPVFDAGVIGGVSCIAMEFVQIGDRPFLRNAPDFAALAEAFAGAADGLHHAHRQGIVHRDVKPSNLILDREGRLRILDFGLARLEGQQSLTLRGDVVGTPLYMSPEQAQPRRMAVDHRTDIYSLGATLYETLAGEPPFPRGDYRETLVHILTREPRPLRRSRDGIPRDLETIVLKCLRKEPRDRYSTAEALAQDLRRFARSDPIEARSQSGLQVVVRRAWRRKGLLASLASAILLLATTALLLAKYAKDLEAESQARFERLVQGGVLRLELARPLRDAGEGAASDPAREALRDLDEAVALRPRSPEAHYHRARCLRALHRDGEAAAELARAVEFDPGFVPAVELLEVIGREEGTAGGRNRSAEGGGAPASAPAGRWEDAWRRAHEADVDGRWSDAVEAYGRLVREERERGADVYLGASAEIYLGRGAARRKCGRLLAALEDFATARARWPDAMEPTLLLGETYLLLGEAALGRETLDELYAVTPAPSRDKVALKISFVHHNLRDYATALAWAERIGDPAARHRQRADLLRHLGKVEEALEAGKAALARDPSDASVRETMARVLADAGRLPEAIAAFEEAVRLDTRSAVARHNLALALERSGDLKRAEAEYRRAIEINPTFSIAHRGLAGTLSKSNRTDDAIEEYRRAIRFDPDDAVAHHNLGNLLGAGGRFAEAVEEFRAAVRINPREPLSRLNLAFNLQCAGNAAGAIEGYREALRLDPSLVKGRYNLSIVLGVAGRPCEAVEEHCAGLALDAGLDPSLVDLGARLDALRDPANEALLRPGARSALARAAALLESSAARPPAVREALERVRALASQAEAPAGAP